MDLSVVENVHVAYSKAECVLCIASERIAEEMHLLEMFLPNEIISSKSLISCLSSLDVWFQQNIDALDLFDC